MMTRAYLPEQFGQDLTPQVTGQVAEEVLRLLEELDGEMSRADLQDKLGLSARASCGERYLGPAQMAAQSSIDPALSADLAKGVLRARDLEARGVARAQLGRWVASGALVRVGRGLYALPERKIGAYESIVHAASRVDSGIVCLLSALQFHELGTQNPPEVWLAVPRTARAPRLDWPALRVIRWSGAALTEGIIERKVDGVNVRITTPARSVADCFKHRSLVGLDVAIEALRDYRRKRAGTLDELMQAARVCRLHRVIQPYVEAVT